jgi:hypothetical protein
VECSKCGKTIDNSEKICQFCGNDIQVIGINSQENKIKNHTPYVLETLYSFISATLLIWFFAYLNQQVMKSNYSLGFLNLIHSSYFWFFLPILFLLIWQFIYGAIFLFTCLKLSNIRNLGNLMKSIFHMVFGLLIMIAIININQQMDAQALTFVTNLYNNAFWIILPLLFYSGFLVLYFIFHLLSINWDNMTFNLQLLNFVIGLGYLLEMTSLILISLIFYEFSLLDNPLDFQTQLGKNIGFIQLPILLIIATRIIQGILYSIISNKH